MEIYSLHGGEAIRPARGGRWPEVRAAGSGNKPGTDPIVTAHKSQAHPKNGVMLYRIALKNRTVIYATDIEEKSGGWPDIIDFVQGADLLIHDAQYLKEEYFSPERSRQGWGHSTIDGAVEVARKAKVKRLVLFHHKPTHDDRTVRRVESYARRPFPQTRAAYEGMTLCCEKRSSPANRTSRRAEVKPVDPPCV